MVERMKLALGITGIPAASAEDVLDEARSTDHSKGKTFEVVSSITLSVATISALLSPHTILRAVGAAFAALTGILAAPILYASTSLGPDLLLKGFAAARGVDPLGLIAAARLEPTMRAEEADVAGFVALARAAAGSIGNNISK